MYSIVKFQKPLKHLKGAKNKDLVRSKPYKLLLDAEIALYDICTDNFIPGKNIGYRLDDERYNEQREFFNCDTGLIYVKTAEKNAVGKLSYVSFTLPEYRKWLIQKKKNPFTKII
jgi:hypothetical protein